MPPTVLTWCPPGLQSKQIAFLTRVSYQRITLEDVPHTPFTAPHPLFLLLPFRIAIFSFCYSSRLHLHLELCLRLIADIKQPSVQCQPLRMGLSLALLPLLLLPHTRQQNNLCVFKDVCFHFSFCFGHKQHCLCFSTSRWICSCPFHVGSLIMM